MAHLDDQTHTDTPREAYASHVLKLYEDGIFSKVLPIVTTSPNALEEHARNAMGAKAFSYIYGGAGEMSTMDANRLAFRQWKIIPRVLRPTGQRSMEAKLFGVSYRCPVLMAPVGVQGLYHPSGEQGLIDACAELGIPYTLSTAATASIEQVAEMCGSHSHWYQLYWPKDNEITQSLLLRAKSSGFSTLVVTLDTVTVGWRPHDLDIANMPFLGGTGNAVGFSDPVFRRKFAERSGNKTPEQDPLAASRYWISEIFSAEHHSWEALKLLRETWDGPIVLKGILSVEDARLALEHGVDGIIVSNHGGRQVDGAVASLEMLPDIVDAVGDRMTVMLDSGIRTGADIIKALSLGAQAIFVGRPALYGLGIAGKDGAKAVLAGILADMDQSMAIAGFRNIRDLNKSILRRVGYGGDVKACR
ncbi:FMN-dependent dehydrogenase [Dactylonectria estremocensis]|uniref:FMN-dependent dehydrogenase n=1 Tax=Dactylonectria estremocensis TaxID=1079267 RepID=A0A9P9ILJ9_9HYPO|nr:FMN-dependent dehydrogenase [Dactylonectria estremocensis]